MVGDKVDRVVCNNRLLAAYSHDIPPRKNGHLINLLLIITI